MSTIYLQTDQELVKSKGDGIELLAALTQFDETKASREWKRYPHTFPGEYEAVKQGLVAKRAEEADKWFEEGIQVQDQAGTNQAEALSTKHVTCMRAIRECLPTGSATHRNFYNQSNYAA